MGAKSTKQGQSAAEKGQGKRFKAPKIRASSLPDMVGGGEVCMEPSGVHSREDVMKTEQKSGHAVLSRQATPPPDYNMTPEEVRQNYITTTEKMVKIWPSYAYLKNFDLDEVDSDIVDKITQVFSHLLDQHSLIQTLSADKKRLNAVLQEGHDLMGRNRGTAKQALEKRLSADALDFRGRASTSPVNLTKIDPTLDPKQKLMEDLQKMRDQALKSSSKRRSVDPQPADGTESCSPLRQRRNETKTEELTAKVKALQEELDKEKTVRITLPSSERSDMKRTKEPEVKNQREMTRSRLQRDYERLSKYMMSEVKAELDHTHKALDDRAKYQFLCSVMEECVETCERMKETLIKSLKCVLLHPTKPMSGRDGQSSRKRKGSAAASRTSVLENISLFESAARPSQKTADHMRQFVEEEKLPPELEKDAMGFIATISEYVETRPIVKEVTEKLKKSHQEILTEALCSNTTIKKFLNECCKIAWTICIQDPPMKLEAQPGVKFKEEDHIPFRSQKHLDATVDYYLWPVLVDNEGGDKVVIGKGRVCLTK